MAHHHKHGSGGCPGCNNAPCRRCGAAADGYGVLRSVTGPWPNRPEPPDFPFYTGPCGPCEHHHCGCGGCHCRDEEPCPGRPAPPPGGHAAAVFSCGAPVELAAGDCVDLRPAQSCGEFASGRDGIRIRRPGAYMVLYTVQVPANEMVCSRFVLSLNGEDVRSSMMQVSTVRDDTASSYSMQAVIRAGAGDTLQLRALDPVYIGCGAEGSVFTLTLCGLN